METPSRIICFDLATKSGYATYDNGKLSSGIKDFAKSKKTSYGCLYHDFSTWVKNFPNYDLYVAERSVMLYRAATEICFAMFSRVEEYAYTQDKPFRAVPPKVIKKFISGKGNCDKAPIIKWFQTTFHRDPLSPDESDAMALLFYVLKDFNIDVEALAHDV